MCNFKAVKASKSLNKALYNATSICENILYLTNTTFHTSDLYYQNSPVCAAVKAVAIGSELTEV